MCICTFVICRYAYIFIRIYAYTYVDICIYIYVHTCVHMCVDLYIYMYVYTYMSIRGFPGTERDRECTVNLLFYVPDNSVGYAQSFHALLPRLRGVGWKCECCCCCYCMCRLQHHVQILHILTILTLCRETSAVETNQLLPQL